MLPGLSAVARVVDAAVLLWRSQSAERTDVDAVGVGGIYQDATDAAALRQPHVGPSLTAVGRLVHTIASHVDVTDPPGLAGSGPDRFRLRRSHGHCANRCRLLIIEDRIPFRAAIGCLEYSAGSGSDVVSVALTRCRREGGHAIAHH